MLDTLIIFSTGLIDELNKLKIPIVYTLHDFLANVSKRSIFDS